MGQFKWPTMCINGIHKEGEDRDKQFVKKMNEKKQ